MDEMIATKFFAKMAEMIAIMPTGFVWG